MIQFFLLLIILTVAYLPFRSRIFELSAATLLLIPIEAYLAGTLLPLNSVTYGALVLITIACVYLAVPQPAAGFELKNIVPMIVWGYFFVVALALCYRWPDFMPMGERLRDYALLAEVMKYPVHPQEPWMNGAQLNYYLYWYRFGSFLGSFLHLEIWEMYHVLQAVTFSLYITACFRILNLVAGCGVVYSLICAVVTGFGSNYAGVQYALKGDHDAFKWWGPSRVITGAINEFPAWSFLLGDLHPHYLNLCLVPMLALFAWTLWHSNIDRGIRTTVIPAAAVLVGIPWVYNANAWEVPVVGLLAAFFLLICASAFPVSAWMETARSSFKRIKGAAPMLGILAAGGISLYLSSRNIMPGSDQFKLVRDPIKLTPTSELFSHWGIPLTIIAASTVLLADGMVMAVFSALALAASGMISIGIAFIVALLLLNCIRILRIPSAELDFSRILLEAVGLVSLILLFLPELYFLDDPYGGENERMNTIFKAYAADWAPIHIFSFWLLLKAINRSPILRFFKPVLFLLIVIPCAYLSCKFFIMTTNDRNSTDFHITPVQQGLSQLDTRYAGAADAIRSFQKLKDGVTLESQGDPYSLTSHVATLGGKRSYLGWINHVDLLLRRYDESKRRAEVTKSIYESTDCGAARDIMQREGITYLVIGPLEKERFPALDVEKFSCLDKAIVTPSYTILQTPL